ncbi:IS3 family transposase [Acinetobacter sp.]|uniref:IS3 family transposase n=1 Tax=Acinetobacter sp. TaxID=472 RepID=UPI00338F40E0
MEDYIHYYSHDRIMVKLTRTKPCRFQNSALKTCLIKPSNFMGVDHIVRYFN